jgi:hypothetical protein
VHFEVVDVSGANQYRVKPAALVTTCWPAMVLTVRVVPPELAAGADPAEADAAGLLAGAAGVLAAAAEVLPELAQADRLSARAANPATPQIFRI